jgi:hypothetical protein
VHSIASDSKGNLYTTETYEGKRVQKFIYKGVSFGRPRLSGRALAEALIATIAALQQQPRLSPGLNFLDAIVPGATQDRAHLRPAVRRSKRRRSERSWLHKRVYARLRYALLTGTKAGTTRTGPAGAHLP